MIMFIVLKSNQKNVRGNSLSMAVNAFDKRINKVAELRGEHLFDSEPFSVFIFGNILIILNNFVPKFNYIPVV